jgi:hypothetical protein
MRQLGCRTAGLYVIVPRRIIAKEWLPLKEKKAIEKKSREQEKR